MKSPLYRELQIIVGMLWNTTNRGNPSYERKTILHFFVYVFVCVGLWLIWCWFVRWKACMRKTDHDDPVDPVNKNENDSTATYWNFEWKGNHRHRSFWGCGNRRKGGLWASPPYCTLCGLAGKKARHRAIPVPEMRVCFWRAETFYPAGSLPAMQGNVYSKAQIPNSLMSQITTSREGGLFLLSWKVRWFKCLKLRNFVTFLKRLALQRPSG